MEQMEMLKDYLGGTTKHGNYQELPPCVPPHIKAMLPNYNSVRLETPRFAWLDQHGVFDKARIVEIGANAGYFSIRAASEKGINSITYEPDPKLAKAMHIISEVCGVDKQIDVRVEPFTLGAPSIPPECDLIINLNVIHHAGHDFDRELIPHIDDWYPYAVKYLNRLGGLAPTMVFQTGYTWGGGRDYLCPPKIGWHEWTTGLLQNAGWQVAAYGCAIKDQKTGYRKYVDGFDFKSNVEMTTKHGLLNNVVATAREIMPAGLNKVSKAVYRRLMRKRLLEHQVARFAMRPLYICKR